MDTVKRKVKKRIQNKKEITQGKQNNKEVKRRRFGERRM